jgi:hypothetical protein
MSPHEGAARAPLGLGFRIAALLVLMKAGWQAVVLHAQRTSYASDGRCCLPWSLAR